MNIFNRLRFDIKSMGISFFIPIFVQFIYLIIVLLFPIQNLDARIVTVSFQVLITPLGAWWIAYHLSEMYYRNGEEILIKFYSPNFILDIVRFNFLFIIFIVLSCIIISIKVPDINLIYIMSLTISQSIFFSSLSSIITIFFKSIDLALTLIILYASIEGITLGKVIPWLHVFSFDKKLEFGLIVDYIVLNIILSIVFLLLSVVFIKRIERNLIS
ncbi:hypothetical protein G9298_28540 (plasmid) [Bacillus thuringiensis]|uniref:hypothetical protein n=1 Tax=Bacillus wiedmannii TaxID=1890302 RepID=UPI000D093557|nr:hypothetical protein [Bacillus wiedmannii]PRT15844.1 hypothetical protein C6360_27355 [Bacillus wiedmannii]QPW51620.1 hypothetical protein G9298_28540 [Bacillus thuringiensis]